MRLNDFNLAPPKKPSVFFNWVLPMFLFFGTLAALLIAAVLYPQIELASMRYEKQSIDAQFETLAGLKYDEYEAQAEDIKRVFEIVDAFKTETTTFFDVYTALSSARDRDKVSFASVSVRAGVAAVSGTAAAESEVHAFKLALDKDTRLTECRIISVRENTDSGTWSFDMSVSYKVPVKEEAGR